MKECEQKIKKYNVQNDDNHGPRRNGVVYQMGVDFKSICLLWLVGPVGQEMVVAI